MLWLPGAEFLFICAGHNLRKQGLETTTAVITIKPMADDLYKKLRRLGVVKGARELKPAPAKPQLRDTPADASDNRPDGPPGDKPAASRLEQIAPAGLLVETSRGACFVVDAVYPLSFRHGQDKLSTLLDNSLHPASVFCRDPRLASLKYQDLLFVDTETTGLTGAGTVAFMVGVAFFEDSALIVRQFFLRDYADEPAMLTLFARLVAERQGLVTFNGRTFDLPLPDNRYRMQGLDVVLGDPLIRQPHIDLLPPARRLWRRRLGSCSLSSLEKSLLGLRRSRQDVPGWAIPAYYFDYLRTGDAGPLEGVFYHNQIDMLSMVTLLGRILRHFDQPVADDYAPDLLSLARWQTALDLQNEAEQTLRLAIDQDPPLELCHQALLELGALLKRAGRREEAVPLWQQVAVTTYEDLSAHVELAMHYEWHEKDLHQARDWTTQALDLSATAGGRAAELLQEELLHRLARLERKLATGSHD